MTNDAAKGGGRLAPRNVQLKPVLPVIAGAINWAWIVGAIAVGEYLGWNPLTVALALIATGVHFHRNAIIGHDGAHYLITRDRVLNDLFVNILFFWPAFATVSGYRDWHFKHHRWVGTDKDPELEVKSGPRYRIPKNRWKLFGECALDLLGYGAAEVLRLLWVVRPKRKIEYLGPIVWWGVVGGALIANGMGYVIAILVGAQLTSFWCAFRLRSWCEHKGVEGTHRFTSSAIMKYVFFPHNTWCHYEHHRWPYLPYYALPEARRIDAVDEPVVSLSDVLSRFEVAPVGSSNPISTEKVGGGRPLNQLLVGANPVFAF